ncbi:MAG TPA: class I adenylate-forming enzyme family protein [Kofleriaceae bacterium]|nr:class I adenylate-forming enzyme family protein [Kofleriaceae bacterium]
MLSWLLERSEEEAVAFIRPGGEGLTYGALAMAVRAVADALLAQVGDVSHLAVAIAVEDQAGFLVASLAVLASGGVVVPLDVRAGEAAMTEQARRARVVAAVRGSTGDDALHVVPGDASRRALGPSGGAGGAERSGTGDPAAALILFTSGSSGAPKGVVLSRAGLQANIDAILGYLPIGPKSRTPLLLPLVYSYTLVGQALTTLRAGGTLLGLSGIAYPALQIAALSELQADGLSSVPTALRQLARASAELPEAERPRLTYVASAGAPLDAATVALLGEGFPGAQLWNQYGLTEASPRVTAISDAEPAFAAGSVGRPIAGVSVSAAPDGELIVRGPSVMMGYLDDPEGTARALGPEGLRTGDLGRVDDGGYVYVTGRKDGLVKIGGERVSVEEIASLVRGVDGVEDACVLATDDPLTGARLVAFVQVPAGSSVKERVRAFTRDRLPPAKRPAKVVELESLPRTANGKVDLQALRRMVEVT